MSNILLLILVFVLILIFTLYANKIGNSLKIIDKPMKGKIHKYETPLIGGLPVAVFSFIFLLVNFSYDNNLNIIILCALCFFIIGYVDDKNNINAYVKLSAFTVIFLIVLIINENLPIERIYIEQFDKVIVLKNLSIPFTTLCLLLLLNAVNLSDGINGLTSGLAVIWLLFLIINSSSYIKIYCIFLLILLMLNTFNIIRGKYFLGDSGTLTLGALIGLMTILTYNINSKNGLLMSVEKMFILFMIPGVDMFRLFIFRIIKRRDPFSRDLDHLHHILLKRFSLNSTLLIYFSIMTLTIGLSYFNIIRPLNIILIYLIGYIFFIFFYKKSFYKPS